MAGKYPAVVRDALRMKKIGNDIITVLGGREIHPINLRVGGFYKVPRRRDLAGLLDDVKWGLEAAITGAKFIADFPFPEFEQDYEYVGLRHPEEYAVIEGRLVSSKGMDIAISEYDHHLFESQVPHSTALHTHVKQQQTCQVGPLARVNLNYHQLAPIAQETAQAVGLGPQCRNPFKSILARIIEVVGAFDEARRIIESYEEPDQPAVEVQAQAGTGYGCTEAPRGICYHRYTIDDAGIITDAKIVSPTAVNQATIEKDLRAFVQGHIDLPDDQLQYHCEQAVRNYDPCISCSAHFLKLKVDRG